MSWRSHPWSKAARELRLRGRRLKKPEPAIPRWKIVTGDRVSLISGPEEEIGKVGTVLRVDRKQNKLYVEGVREHSRLLVQDDGSKTFVQSAAPVHYASVALLDPKDDQPCRVRFIEQETEDGRVKRVRYSTRSQLVIPKPEWSRRDGMVRALYKDSKLDTPKAVAEAQTYVPSVRSFEENVLEALWNAGGNEDRS